jgi:Ca-activated chloride channel family protein
MNRSLLRSVVLLVLLTACGSSNQVADVSAPIDAVDALSEVRPTDVRGEALPTPTEAFVVIEVSSVGAAERTQADESGAVRLVYSDIQVHIEGDVARTVVTDVFKNDLETEVSSTYSFPLPDDGAVVGFADFPDGERLDATVEGRDEAREEFERAVGGGERAALGETESGHRFRMELSPLAAGESRRVELTYVQTLVPIGGERMYVFPAQHSTGKRPRVLELSVKIVADEELTSIAAPNHPASRRVALGARAAEMSLHRMNQSLSHDFAVRWTEPTEPVDLSSRAARLEEGAAGFAEVRFAFNQDPWPDVRPPKDVVIVVDTSLSMAGSPLRRASALVEQVMDELSERDRVAIVSFDDAIRSWAGLESATPEVRERAVAEAKAWIPGGYSNIEGAIDQAAELIHGNENAVILFATDGQSTIGENLEELSPAAEREDFDDVQTVIALFNYPGQQETLHGIFRNAATHYVPDGDAGDESIRNISRLVAAPII